MKRVKLTAVAVLMIASALCISLNAQQRGGRPSDTAKATAEKSTERVEKLAEKLGLDEAQTAKFIAAQKENSEAVKKLSETTKEKMKAVKEAAEKDKAKLTERSDAAIAKILTAEQLEQLESIKSKAKSKAARAKGVQRGGQRGGKGKMMMQRGGGQRGGKMMMQRSGGSNMMQMQMMMRMMSMYNQSGMMKGGRPQSMQGKRPQGMQHGKRPQGMQRGMMMQAKKDGDTTKAAPTRGGRPQKKSEAKTESAAE